MFTAYNSVSAFSCAFREMIGRYRQPASMDDVIDTSASTETQCRTSCLTDGECLAFTWSGGCRKHKAITYLIPDDNAVYYRKPCPGATNENGEQYLQACCNAFNETILRFLIVTYFL